MDYNVVVVVLDALREDRVGACGGRPLTPNIDSIATEGTTFENAFTVINTTDPAMTSLHTGLHPHSHGILNHGDRVTQDEKQQIEAINTLPEILGDHGYETLKFGRPLGRWHKRGFDRYPTPTSNSLKVQIYDRLERIHPRFAKGASLVYGLFEPVVDTVEDRREKTEGRVGTDIIDRFLAETENSSSHYSLLHLMDTHGPYNPDPDVVDELLDTYDYDGRPVTEVVNELGEDTITGNNLKNILNKEDEREQLTTGRIKARYDACVREVDKKIGELVRGLRESDGLQDTILIILSDHGESLTEHGIYFDHHGLYDETTKIPLMIYHPDWDPCTFEDFVQTTDIFPTILDCLEISIDRELDGNSLMPFLTADRPVSRSTVFAEESHTQRRRMIRTMKWKYIHLIEDNPVCRYCGVIHAEEEELYDLKADPNEETNLLARHSDPKINDIKEELRVKEEEFRAGLNSDTNRSNQNVRYEDEDEILELLEDLGYK